MTNYRTVIQGGLVQVAYYETCAGSFPLDLKRPVIHVTVLGGSQDGVVDETGDGSFTTVDPTAYKEAHSAYLTWFLFLKQLSNFF